MKMITIAVKRPNDTWKLKEVEDTLETYQHIVGGYIEHFHTKDDIAFFCNEEGKFLDLKFNFKFNGDFIMGNVFAARVDDDGEFKSLTEEDLVTLTGEF